MIQRIKWTFRAEKVSIGEKFFLIVSELEKRIFLIRDLSIPPPAPAVEVHFEMTIHSRRVFGRWTRDNWNGFYAKDAKV